MITIQLDLTDDDLMALKAEVSVRHWLHLNQNAELNALDHLGMAVLLAAQVPPKVRKKKPGTVVPLKPTAT